MCGGDEHFDFPIILNMRQQTINKSQKKKKIMKYLSEEKDQTNYALIITFAIDESSYSTPGNINLLLYFNRYLQIYNLHFNLTKMKLHRF